MSKEKTFSLTTEMRKGNSNGCLTLQPNWSISKLTSSSPLAPGCCSCQEGERDNSHRIHRIASDPVGSGLVSSLARPGGNITGLSVMAPDLDGKRLELLKETFPKVARVALLWQSGGRRGNLTLTEMEAAAKALGLKLQSLRGAKP